MGKLNTTEPMKTPVIMPLTLQIALGLWIIGVIVASFMYLPPARGFADPDAARMVVFHVPCAMVAVIAYLVSVVYAIGYLVKGKMLSDTKSAASAGLGLLFTILATITGMLFAKIEWGSAWNWDPRETSILMLLIVYAAYFALRGSLNNPATRARICAVYNILAFVVMPYLMFVLPRQIATLHPSGTLTRGGLSPEYRIMMICAAAGLVWLYIWILRLQVRIYEVETAGKKR